MGHSLTDVNIGTTPNDGTGDPLRTAYDTINGNNAILEAAAPVFYSFNTGALSAGVLKNVTHNRALTNYSIVARDPADNNNMACQILRPNVADPTNKIDIQVAIAVPGGVTIYICGI